MGNAMQAKSMKSHKNDKDALWRFIESDGQDDAVNQLWKAFDKDGSGSIDQDELQEIVFNLIVLFWKYATPKKSVPKRDQLQSVIDHICQNIMIDVDLDKNGVITRNEFDEFGKYVMAQWHACEQKVSDKRKPADIPQKGSFNLGSPFSRNKTK
mmetsp:Transcript_51394/g.81910  ORF Transcript_51394/g.81910 Transcript_51394/m.81910 type:complete len:154 (+) Transcript_51394:62-523(+)|eukprot:CAMPEP_0197028734 /NCGR_PEP_ID=MMETSP1384-20130603/8343_1 /TAXON_ID=29189 /ORGANISM="Ammonia sp." /LENGTH=153 /DNA_ID=CAMNT_0042457777 /DNA_START=53 /DNA_END=514 /DNA_ORIENTATION=-